MNASYKTAIQFSNLYIPVKLIKISHDSSIELNQLCKDSKERVHYRKYCPSCDKEITNEDIVKGYRYANHPDKFVILEQSDIDSITNDSDKTLKIEHFCKKSRKFLKNLEKLLTKPICFVYNIGCHCVKALFWL